MKTIQCQKIKNEIAFSIVSIYACAKLLQSVARNCRSMFVWRLSMYRYKELVPPLPVIVLEEVVTTDYPLVLGVCGELTGLVGRPEVDRVTDRRESARVDAVRLRDHVIALSHTRQLSHAMMARPLHIYRQPTNQ